jgi:antitoxin (DNA-binding transcriptional repressor) of toxin-antitoxin stability system
MAITTPTEIGAFEAKTHFSDLLRRVEQGEHFIITRHGRPVAEISKPFAAADSEVEMRRSRALAAWNRLQAEHKSHHEVFSEWKDEGRP